MLSLIIPVKNGAEFIGDTLAELGAVTADFEVIVVDDGSTDGTRATVTGCADRDPRIRLTSNPGTGKVQALNHGFNLCRGDIVKCIDADDVLVRGYLDTMSALRMHDAECHDMQLTDAVLVPFGRYAVNPRMLEGDRRTVMEQLVALPRCTWTVGRGLAERIFPMPIDLPFEDVWFALVIKRFAAVIHHRPGVWYLYRQHGDQTFGGILNHSRDKVSFRAKRMLRLITVLQAESARLEPAEISLDVEFRSQRCYWTLLAQDSVSTWSILSSRLPLPALAKLLLFRRMPWMIPSILRVKYTLDGLRLGMLGQKAAA